MREGEREESSSVCVLNVGVDQLTEELEKTGLWVWWDCSGNGIWWKALWDICLCVSVCETCHCERCVEGGWTRGIGRCDLRVC